MICPRCFLDRATPDDEAHHKLHFEDRKEWCPAQGGGGNCWCEFLCWGHCEPVTLKGLRSERDHYRHALAKAEERIERALAAGRKR